MQHLGQKIHCWCPVSGQYFRPGFYRYFQTRYFVRGTKKAASCRAGVCSSEGLAAIRMRALSAQARICENNVTSETFARFAGDTFSPSVV
jgi:hypothetical protein